MKKVVSLIVTLIVITASLNAHNASWQGHEVDGTSEYEEIIESLTDDKSLKNLTKFNGSDGNDSSDGSIIRDSWRKALYALKSHLVKKGLNYYSKNTYRIYILFCNLKIFA